VTRFICSNTAGGYSLPRCESIRSLGSSSYFRGEGVAPVPRRLEVSFPPSFLFELNELQNWAILLLGLCHLFLGLSPVHTSINLLILLLYGKKLRPLFLGDSMPRHMLTCIRDSLYIYFIMRDERNKFQPIDQMNS
jgi:hypothetical protein